MVAAWVGAGRDGAEVEAHSEQPLLVPVPVMGPTLSALLVAYERQWAAVASYKA